MPLTELTDLVRRLDTADLDAPGECAAIARRIEEIEVLLQRLGADSPAAQLAVAASLMRRSDTQASTEDDLRPTVRTLVSSVERAFHVGASAPRFARLHAEEPPAPVASRGPDLGRAVALRLSVARDMLLGETLVYFGVVSAADVEAALELQRGTDRRLGEVLVEHDFTTQDEIQRALDFQKRRRESAGPEAASPDGRRRPAKEAGDAKLPPRLRMVTNLLLGEVLVLQGAISRADLALALAQQRKDGSLLGETLLAMGRVTRRQIQAALTIQGRSSRRVRRTKR